MAEMTTEQLQAVAMANARARMAQAQSGQPMSLGGGATQQPYDDGTQTDANGAEHSSPLAAAMPLPLSAILSPTQRADAFVADAVPFNLGDELGAAVRATKSSLTGNKGSWSDNYGGNLSDIRRSQGLEMSAHPALSIAAGLPANIAAAMATGNPESFGGMILQGGGLGAMQGFGSGEGGAVNRLESGVVGAGVGAATSGVLGLAGKALAGRSADPARDLLLNEGVPLTSGQATGPIAQRLESGMTSIPGGGDVVLAAQRKSLEGFNGAAYNRVLGPIGEDLPDDVAPGHDAVAAIQKKIGEAYDSVIPKLQARVNTPEFGQDVADITANLKDAAPAKLDQFTQQVNKIAFRAADDPNNVLTGQAFKDIHTDLGTLARNYMKDSTTEGRYFGQAVSDLRDALLDQAERTTQDPGLIDQLKSANEAYRNFLPVQKAAGAAQANDGVFTPFQLSNAVKASDPSMRKSAFASGNAVMQDLTRAGNKVLGNKVPDSGTPLRQMLSNPLLWPGAILSGGVAGITHNSISQNIARSLIAGARGPLALGAGRALGAIAGPSGAALSPLLTQQLLLASPTQ